MKPTLFSGKLSSAEETERLEEKEKDPESSGRVDAIQVLGPWTCCDLDRLQQTSLADSREALTMSTYGTRRLGRDVPALASSRRRRDAETEEDSDPQDVQLNDPQEAAHSDQRAAAFMRSYRLITVNDTARKQAQQIGDAEIKKKAAELVRYALACEYQRTSIRKEDIRTKVLDEKTSRLFGLVFNAAQEMLYRTFGFHMVEVRAKGADNAELTRQAQEVLRAAASSANGLRSREKQPDESCATDGGLGTNIWILQSAFSPDLIKELVSVDDELTKAYASTSEPTWTSDRRRQAASLAKSAVDWKRADRQDGEMGLLYVILALILVNGRTITDATLHMYLRRIHLTPHTPLPAALRGTGPAQGSGSTGSQSTQTQSRARATQGTLEGFMNAMIKQSYLEKQRSDIGIDHMTAAVNQAQAQGRRRGRTSGAGGRANNADDESTVWEWRWGSRAEAEIGEKKVAELISLLFTDPSVAQDGVQGAEEEDEETQAIDQDRLAKRRKMLLTNIASVAGSQLID